MKKEHFAIKLANVTKRFGSLEAVSDATLVVKSGEIVGFVGPNGAGKTTAISMMMGFLAASKGYIEVLGQLITPQTAHKVHKRIGYVAGDMALPSHLTAAQYLDFVAHSIGRDKKRYDQLIHQLAPVLDKPLKSLSRGNKQKIALIAALQHHPELLILDEPTSGLDPLMQNTFLDMVRQAAASGTTVFMSSHILSEISEVCDRIVFMKNGKFIVDQPVAAITSQLGKYIVISAKNISSIASYAPDYVTILRKETQALHVSVPTSEIKAFMRWIVTKQFDDISIEDRDLDDVFHELYMNKTKKGK